MFKKEIVNLICRQTKLKKTDIESSIEVPPNPKMGDYAFPCFILAKKLKKNPVEIAQDLATKIKKSPGIQILR